MLGALSMVSSIWIAFKKSNRTTFCFYSHFVVEDEVHSDFIALRSMLIRTNLNDLRDVTHNIHYENYRYKKLSSFHDNNVSKNIPGIVWTIVEISMEFTCILISCSTSITFLNKRKNLLTFLQPQNLKLFSIRFMLLMSSLERIKRLVMLNSSIITMFRNKFEHSNSKNSNPSQLI